MNLSEANFELSEDELRDIIRKLTAFTYRYAFDNKSWFRKGSDSLLKGKKVEDYVYEAIGRYFENPEKHNTERGSLFTYLSTVVMTLVGNDLRSKENKTTWAIPHEADGDENGNKELDYFDLVTRRIEENIEDQIYYDQIVKDIVEEIAKQEEAGNKDILEKIYLGLDLGLKPKDIMETFKMPNGEYNNGIRRLRTIVRKIVSKYED